MPRTPVNEVDPLADPRLRTACALAEACAYEAEHTHQVVRIALCLFDQLQGVHGYGEEERFHLNAAALLHDIGWIEGQRAHHKTALRLILESPTLDYDEPTRLLIGSIARYHRKALPDPAKHDHFAELDDAEQAEVRVLAGILRTADGLDGSHRNVVIALGANADNEELHVECDVNGDGVWEQQRAQGKGELLGEALNRRLAIRCDPA